jgi:hypothetical protein
MTMTTTTTTTTTTTMDPPRTVASPLVLFLHHHHLHHYHRNPPRCCRRRRYRAASESPRPWRIHPRRPTRKERDSSGSRRWNSTNSRQITMTRTSARRRATTRLSCALRGREGGRTAEARRHLGHGLCLDRRSSPTPPKASYSDPGGCRRHRGRCLRFRRVVVGLRHWRRASLWAGHRCCCCSSSSSQQ